jgi:replicative DNA helicase
LNYEVSLLNAIIDHDSMPLCLERNVQQVFEQNTDIWNYVQTYYNKYKVLPTKTIVKEHFDEFEMFKTVEAPIEYWIDEAFKESLSKSVRVNLAKSVEMLRDAGPFAAMNFLSSANNKLLRQTGVLKDTNLSQEYTERVKDFADRYHSDKSIIGIPTGIRPIDEIFGGLQAGDFIVLMGWTGSKKSWLSLLLACNAWRAGYRPLIISLEMNRFQMGYRLDTILSNGKNFTNDELTHARGLDPDDYEKWAEETFEGTPPFYLITSDGIDSANQNMVQAKVEQYQPDLVILDYHGLFEDVGGSGNETEKAKNLSKAFKKIAVKYEVPIIDIAAVTMKDGHEDRPPDLNEMAWSKQLSYDADLVLSMHSKKDSNTVQVVSQKSRRCPLFGFYLDWNLNTGEWSEKYEDEYAFQD